MQQRSLSRRTFTTDIAALSLVGLGRQASAAQEATAIPDASLRAELPSGGMQLDGSWVFTDDRGVTSTLDHMPTKVVAHIGIAAALYDFGFTVSGYYGTSTDDEGNPLTVAGDLPLDDVPSVGETGEVDIEHVLSLGTEIFIGPNYEIGGGQTIWPVDEGALNQIGEFAQIVAIAYGNGTDTSRSIQSMANFAEALGADLSVPGIEASRASFEASMAALSDALAEKPGLTVAFISWSSTGYWITSGGADNMLYSSLGMNIVSGDDTMEQSWESFGRIEADLLMIDNRPPRWYPSEMLVDQVPTFSLHAAVKAGQMANWTNVYVSSWEGFFPIIDQVAEAVKASDPTIF